MPRRSRQTADDFPEELLYDQQYLWVAPGRNGSARIGLSLPALSETAPNIYFVDLQQMGDLGIGTTFGAVDLDTGRMELSAPFSARIAEVNWEVIEDPLVLMAEPFGDGWFYEVQGVADDDLRRLLDRDSFWSFLSFERTAKRLGIPPVLRARYEMSLDAPWPDNLRVTFGGQTVLTGQILRLGRNQTFTPQWTLGDGWEVETRFEQPSLAMVAAAFAAPKEVVLRWRYEVVDTDAPLEGESCYNVKVVEVGGTPPQSYYLLSIAKGDFTLRLIEEVSLFDEARRTRQPNDWGRETYLELRQPRELLLDLPMFPSENRDETRTVTVAGEPEIQQETRFPDGEVMEITCEAAAGDTSICSEQTWQRGLPWWREARRSTGDRVLMKARLIPADEATEEKPEEPSAEIREEPVAGDHEEPPAALEEDRSEEERSEEDLEEPSEGAS
ncbi:hypothetical protein ACFL59_02520 [Planctomycetota bacterium]